MSLNTTKPSLKEIALDTISSGLIVIDHNKDKILLYNNAFLELWNIPINLMENFTATELFNYLQTKTSTNILPIAHPISETGYEVLLNDGTYLERNTRIVNKDLTNNNLHVLYEFRNITAKKQLELTLENKASFDSLTGLANRTLLTYLLQKIIATASRNNFNIAVLFIDLDSFKAINDTFGHNYGDQLLQNFALRLKNLVRTDDIVARLAGDEFVVALKSDEADPAYLTNIIDRLFSNILQPYNFNNKEITVTASVGISFYPENGLDPDTLIKNADAAMYHAKELGKSTYQIYNKEISRKLLERIQLEHDLRIAIQKQELFLQYQPIVDLTTNKTITMEALLRWQHPGLGLVPPSTLIPIAESSGMIHTIGKWVLKTACQQLKSWHDSGFSELKVAINLAESQIKQENIVTTTQQVLQDTGLDPKYIELEVEERVFLTQGNIILQKLFELKALGISINIDDFGTCYAKFASLSKFPMDCIKVDRTLVKNFVEHPELSAIITSIATVAQALKLNLIAEGVETKEQLELIKTIFTDQAQGYLFGKPFSSEEATILLKQQFKA